MPTVNDRPFRGDVVVAQASKAIPVPQVPGSWAKRRRLMWAVTVFCMAAISYVLRNDMDSGPADTTVTMSFVCLISIVGSYVFGAAWDDSKARDHEVARARIGLPEEVG